MRSGLVGPGDDWYDLAMMQEGRMTATVIEARPTRIMEAMEENLAAHVSFLQRRLDGMTVDERGGLMVVDSGLQSNTFNKILAARLDNESADERIDDALFHFRRARRPFGFLIGPCARPLDLEARLRDRGLEAAEFELGMSIELDRLGGEGRMDRGTAIHRVRSGEDLAAFAELLARIGDPPDLEVIRFFERGAGELLEGDCPMRLFLCTVGSEAAAVSELFLGGGVAGVHMVATVGRFRRRGLGMAVTRTALGEGRRAGLTIGVLQASEQGRPVYERLGFSPCGGFVEYAWPDPGGREDS